MFQMDLVRFEQAPPGNSRNTGTLLPESRILKFWSNAGITRVNPTEGGVPPLPQPIPHCQSAGWQRCYQEKDPSDIISDVALSLLVCTIFKASFYQNTIALLPNHEESSNPGIITLDQLLFLHVLQCRVQKVSYTLWSQVFKIFYVWHIGTTQAC